MCLFLSPIVLAVVGAICLGASGQSQLVGGIAGLVLGMALSLVVSRAIARGDTEGARSQ
jgi:hypothetical protein